MPDDVIAFDGTQQESPVNRQNIRQKLLEIQRDLKVDKSQWNSFGNYNYRSKEDILEAAKPLCHAHGLILECTDTVEDVGGWKYVRSIAGVIDAESGAAIRAEGLAREPEEKKGMDASQITGTASSYAGKRALGNLFALDDTKDSDALGPAQPAAKKPPAQGPFKVRCKACGHTQEFPDADNYAQWVAYWGSGGQERRCCPTPMLEVV